MYATLVLLSIISAATSAPVPPNIPRECMEDIQKKYAHHLSLSKDQVHDHAGIMKKVMDQIDFSKCMNVQFRIVMDDHEKPAQSKFPVDNNNQERPEDELKEENDAYVLNVKNEDYEYPNSDEERYDNENKDYTYPQYEDQYYHNEKVNKNENTNSKKPAANSYGGRYAQSHNHRQLYGSQQGKTNKYNYSNTQQHNSYRQPNDNYDYDSLLHNSDNHSKHRINNNKNPNIRKVKIQNENKSHNNPKNSKESESEYLITQSEESSNERYNEDNIDYDESNNNDYWKFNKNTTPQSMNEHDHHRQIVDYSTTKRADTSYVLHRGSDNLENSHESMTEVPKILNNNPSTGKYLENNSDNDESKNRSSWDFDNETTPQPVINHKHEQIINYSTTNRADSSHEQNKATENPENSPASESEVTDIQKKNLPTEKYYENNSDNDKPKNNDSWNFSKGKTPQPVNEHDHPWQIIDYSTLNRPDTSREREHKHDIVFGKEVQNIHNDNPSTETFKNNNDNNKEEPITTVKDGNSITKEYLSTTELTKPDDVSTDENKLETTTPYAKTTAEPTNSSFTPSNENTTPKMYLTTTIESNEQNNYKTITEIDEVATEQNDNETIASESSDDNAATVSYHNTDSKEYSTTTEISHVASTTRETVQPRIEKESNERTNQPKDNKVKQNINLHTTPAINLQSTNDEEKQKDSLVSFITKISLDEAGLLTIDNQLIGEKYKEQSKMVTYFTTVFNTVYEMVWNSIWIIRSLIQTYGQNFS